MTLVLIPATAFLMMYGGMAACFRCGFKNIFSLGGSSSSPEIPALLEKRIRAEGWMAVNSVSCRHYPLTNEHEISR